MADADKLRRQNKFETRVLRRFTQNRRGPRRVFLFAPPDGRYGCCNVLSPRHPPDPHTHLVEMDAFHHTPFHSAGDRCKEIDAARDYKLQLEAPVLAEFALDIAEGRDNVEEDLIRFKSEHRNAQVQR